MAGDELNLSGGWFGKYNDPELGAVSFFAILEERPSGRHGVCGFSGTMSFGPKVAHAEQVGAPLIGSRMADAAQFIRWCAGDDGAGAEVQHNGLIKNHGTIYEGIWNSGGKTGIFIMTRAVAQMTAEDEAALVSVGDIERLIGSS